MNLVNRKKELLLKLLNQFLVIPIEAKDLVEAYAELDAFSQGISISRPVISGMTARNMGKNDLWIAATALVTKSTLITTDNDFDHFDGQYFNVIKPV
jgi:tRNA(fMet)-specific endonuclease VapC